MSTITSINGTDRPKDSRTVINTNFANLNDDKVETLSDLGVTVSATQINDLVTSNSLVPTGSIFIWATGTAPTGYLFCRGQAVSRTVNAALFAVLGTTYGVGDGSTTFNLPNLQGRVPVGFDSAQTEFDTIGETGGAKTHTLLTTEMPSHRHSIVTQFGSGSANLAIFGQHGGNTVGGSPTYSDLSDGDPIIENTGGGGAHNNLQPYIALNYIIKT